MTFRLSNKLPVKSRDVEEKLDEKRKFIFVLEGEKTEHIYVQAVAQNIKEGAIVDVLILERIQTTHSNQYKIVSSIQNYMDENARLEQAVREVCRVQIK